MAKKKRSQKRRGIKSRPGWTAVTVRLETVALADKVAKILHEDDGLLPSERYPMHRAIHRALHEYLKQAQK